MLVRASGEAKLDQREFVISAAAAVATPEAGPPTVECEAYNGGPMRPDTDPPVPYPLVVDLATLKTRARTAMIFDHDFRQLVGQYDTHDNDGKTLRLRGIVTGNIEDPKSPAAEVVTHARNGFTWPVSVGVTSYDADVELIAPGNSVKVNGRTIDGPVLIVRHGRLKEVSFVPYSADATATARISAHATDPQEPTMPTFEEWLAARDLDRATLSASAIEALRADFDIQARARTDDPDDDNDPDDDDAEPTRGKPRAKPRRGKKTRAKSLEEIRARRARHDEIEVMATALAEEDPDALEEITELCARAQSGDWTIHEFEATARRDILSGRRVDNRQRSTSRDQLTDDLATAGLCLSAGLPEPEKHFSEQTLEVAARRFRHGLGLQELLLIAARQYGYSGTTGKDAEGMLRAIKRGLNAPLNVRAAGSTIDLPGILSNTANKFLERGFRKIDQGWRRVCRVRRVSDFKALTRHALTGDYTAKELAKGGKIEHAVPSEVTYTNKANTYARMGGISREDIINDDLDALSDVPELLGVGCIQAFNRIYWKAFIDAFPTLFTTENGNRIAQRLSFDSLTDAVVAFAEMKNPNGEPLGIMPAILLTTADLHPLAQRLYNSTELRDNGAAGVFVTSNEHAAKYTPVSSPWLSSPLVGGVSGRACLLANPDELAVMEVVFLNGKQVPTIETSEASFNELGIEQRAYHDWGVTTIEHRAGVAIEAEEE